MAPLAEGAPARVLHVLAADDTRNGKQ